VGNVSVKQRQRAYKNKTMRHKRNNNTYRLKKRRNKTRRGGGSSSSLLNSITNRDGSSFTVHSPLSKLQHPSLQLKKKSSKKRKKKRDQTPTLYLKEMQKKKVGKPGTIGYLVRSMTEQKVLPKYNKVIRLFRKSI